MKIQLKEVLELAQVAYKKFWRPTNDESKGDKSAAKVTRHWQEKVMRLGNGWYQTEVPIPELGEKIDLVNLTDRIAYELKASGNNPGHEFYKDVFKILVFNEKSKRKIRTLVFITEKKGVEKLKRGLGAAAVGYARKLNLQIELIPF